MLSVLGYKVPDPLALTVHTDGTTKTVDIGIYGRFPEHIFDSVHGGLWGDRDTYQFGTDEFIRFCELVKAEPILVLNTSRGVDDALNWLEYCMGDETTEYGKQRAANGKVVSAVATIEGRTVKFTMPPLSVGVVRVTL